MLDSLTLVVALGSTAAIGRVVVGAFGVPTQAAALATAPVDPRLPLATLELEGRNAEALARAQQELADRPAASHQVGLDYLRGHLLALLGRPSDAAEAFGAAMGNSPRLSFYSRYRLSLEQEQLGHPEMAAGLIATAIGKDASSPLLAEAVRTLVRTLGRGGDCRLLRNLKPRQLPAPERRQIVLAQAECTLRGGTPDSARSQLVSLLEENHEDDVARIAAERLAGLLPDTERGRLALLLATTFFEHRDFERSLRQLGHVLGYLGSGKTPASREIAEARYTLGRVHFWQGRFAAAAQVFGSIAESSGNAAERARALFQQGRAFEMLGQWQRATASFRLAYLAQPEGEWAASSLLSTLRLEWRAGNEAPALSILEVLAANGAWRESTRRASLFLATSDLVRGRGDRAEAWLDRAGNGSRDDEQPEIAYWRGRLAEVRHDGPAAVAAYLGLLRLDLYHPLAQAALARLPSEPLAHSASELAHKLAASRRREDLLGAWLLLGPGDATGRAVESKLRQLFGADRGAAPFIAMSEVPIAAWPLWTASLHRPEELLLALGAWSDGAPAVREHFPPSDPSLGLTGSLLLARNGETARSIQLAEAMRERLPSRLPAELLARPFQQCLYPLAYREPLLAEGRLRGLDPYLLAALIRAESRFDHRALSAAAARGLTQFALPTARHVASRIGMERLEADDLYKPEVAIDLGGAYLAALLHDFGGRPHLAITAYNAGEPQAQLWRSYCFSTQPEEYFSKIGSRETRGYVERVLSNWAHYQRLYS
jgi:soluble lytic murein transglycosylase